MVNDDHGAHRPPRRRPGLGRPRQSVLLDRPPERHRRLLGARRSSRSPTRPRSAATWSSRRRCTAASLWPRRPRTAAPLGPGRDGPDRQCAARTTAGADLRSESRRQAGAAQSFLPAGEVLGPADRPVVAQVAEPHRPARSRAAGPRPARRLPARSARAAAAATTAFAIRKPGRSHATSSAQARASPYRPAKKCAEAVAVRMVKACGSAGLSRIARAACSIAISGSPHQPVIQALTSQPQAKFGSSARARAISPPRCRDRR